MDINQLVQALHEYEQRKRALDPEMYIGLDLFRRYFPDIFTLKGPPGKSNVSPKMIDVFRKLLAGDDCDLPVEDFGFTFQELKATLKDCDPVKKPIPEKLVLMTFDDSTLDHYEKACPELEKYGGKAILFTTEMEKGMFGAPGFWDKKYYMTWEQIKELSDRGHEIANHTLHHNVFFTEADDETIIREVKGLEELCATYGIPKPSVIGYPMGPCNPRVTELLRKMGYKWGRGSMESGSPFRLAGGHYDPHWDSPLVVPGVFVHSKENLVDALNNCKDGKVMLLVFHNTSDEMMLKMEHVTYKEIVDTIYDNGGNCITFKELEEYVDPLKAWEYTHPAYPESETLVKSN